MAKNTITSFHWVSRFQLFHHIMLAYALLLNQLRGLLNAYKMPRIVQHQTTMCTTITMVNCNNLDETKRIHHFLFILLSYVNIGE